jgi:glycosyltransferase involved in cell wall biosynthesis
LANRILTASELNSSELPRPKIVAAIPCFNTEPTIGELVTRARKYVDQVVVVDDGSHDGTAEVATAAGVLVIKHGTNKGYGEAIKSCFPRLFRNW